MPNIEKKQAVIGEIKDKLNKAKSAILVDARGLTVEQDTELRKRLREASVDYKVYKNSMMDFAVKDTPFDGLKEHFKGPSALAVCYDDPMAAARIISKAKKTMPALEFKAGIVENSLYDANAVQAIAEIPSREELLSLLLGSLKSPLSSFARVIQAVADKQGEAPEAPETA